MNIETIIFAIVGIALLYGIIKLFKLPFKIIYNSIVGVILLYVTNLLGAYIGIGVGINWITALIAGFLGVPGVIFLIIFQNFL